MPIRFSCGSCGSVLRVAEQHIGKQAKCPKCGSKCVVPPESEPDQPARSAPPSPPQQSAANIAPPSGLPELGEPQAAPPSGFPAIGKPSTAAASSSVPSISSPTTAPTGAASPYAAPLPASSGGGNLSNTIMHPLYEARTMMNWFGWFLFVVGCIYCATIVGAIIGWLPLWMGSLVKGASKSIKMGVERGDQNQLRLANQRLATFFKICGVLTIIYVCLIGIWFAFVVFALIVGAFNGGM